jgi:L-ascorbate oxidase
MTFVAKVRITNNHPTSSVTIHFHGIHQKNTPYSDGPAFVTQCPLGPYQTQEYVFEAYPPGTHFWHAHASLAAADGVSGAFIVRPKNPEPFQYNEEVVMFLQDWYIKTGSQQIVGLYSWPFVWVGNPNTLLINGKGIAAECLEGGASFGNPDLCLDTCQSSPLDLLDITTVNEGETYRLRIINAAQLVMINFAITEHNLTIVQVEGTNVKPVTVTSLDISPGQRYDVLVKADQTPGSYWIETTVRERNISTAVGRAILQYASAPNATELPVDSPVHAEWNETSHGVAQDSSLFTVDVNAHPEAVALNATDVKRYILVGTQNQVIVDGEPQRLVWALNNVSNIPHAEPLISKAVRSAKLLGWPTELEDSLPMPQDPPFVWDYTQAVWDEGGPGPAIGVLAETNVDLEYGQVFEFVLQNARALNNVTEFHPWHAHGHSFWVVGRGEGIYNPDTDVETYNLENPLLRDTVTLWPLEWVAIRFVANNPGVWFFHCHIFAHEVMGMALHIVTQPDMLDDPPEGVLSCNEQSLTSFTDNGKSGVGSHSFVAVAVVTLSSLVLAMLW